MKVVTYRHTENFVYSRCEDFSNSGEAAFEAKMIFRINTELKWDPANPETKSAWENLKST